MIPVRGELRRTMVALRSFDGLRTNDGMPHSKDSSSRKPRLGELVAAGNRWDYANLITIGRGGLETVHEPDVFAI